MMRTRIVLTVAVLIAVLLLLAPTAIASPSDVQRVAVIGDSITNGCCVPVGYSWVDWFERAQPGDNIQPYAVNGATARRWLQQYLPQLDSMPAWQPHTVVIALGGNEYHMTRPAGEYASHLAQLVQYVHTKAPGARVVLLHYYRILAEFEPNGCDALPNDHIQCIHANPPDSWDTYGTVMKQTALANGAYYVDISHTRDWTLYISSDQAHPTALGHYYLAQDIRAALNALPG
jgi:lysophospholipase L1-like esterase